jgi:hypothetical protein
VLGRVTKVEMIFLEQWMVRSGGSERVPCSGGVDSMLHFRLEREGDGTKRW